jgi:hypothetical protein
MTTYMVEIWNGYEQIPSTCGNNFESLDDAFNSMEEEIKSLAIYSETTRPNREWIKKKLEEDEKVLCYDLLLGYRFYIIRKTLT